MKKAVVALGGNAISHTGKENIHEQFANTRKSLEGIVELVKAGYKLAITHGNGPQVGNALLRVERTKNDIPALPLGVIVADTEGGMGYMIEQSLQNRFMNLGIKRDVITIVTQVIVDPNDPSIINPSKYIGPFYTKKQAETLAEMFNWVIKEDLGRGYRRVVPSPRPRRIVNRHTIGMLVDLGTIVIAAGGGGIPVYTENDGTYEGVDAVVDKDHASAVLAHDIDAQTLLFLTDVDYVYLNYNKPNQQMLKTITVVEAKRYFAEGHFPPGNMGPKIEAAVSFLASGGQEVIITSLDKAQQAISGDAGTRIVNK
ncbi:carbamate kinase [candidate division WOR_3 bacterium SM23_42]|uniref:Carbamate kinase n=1 Tax=candidate division WOR_3 bacterium SM23_42 TaxID=1703779 RepID=A0A0S8FVJ5_UNCW3|nr:MAG: carbamate kinase [candidate division WOR_3 bacterium SM23_42]